MSAATRGQKPYGLGQSKTRGQRLYESWVTCMKHAEENMVAFPDWPQLPDHLKGVYEATAFEYIRVMGA